MADFQALRDSMRASLAAETLRTTGRLRLRAYGTSMLGAIWPGDVLVCERCEVEKLRLDDIVLYVRSGRLIAHRIVELSYADGRTRVVTCGDCLPNDDPPVNLADILGRVTSVQRDGFAPRPISRRSPTRRVISAVLAHSDLLCEVALRIHAAYLGLVCALTFAAKSRNAAAVEVQG